jgi:hypothetical protein
MFFKGRSEAFWIDSEKIMVLPIDMNYWNLLSIKAL